MKIRLQDRFDDPEQRPKRAVRRWLSVARSTVLAIPLLIGLSQRVAEVSAHIIPPENLHPVAEIYRRATFILNLNPIPWDQIQSDTTALSDHWKTIDSAAAERFSSDASALLAKAAGASNAPGTEETLPRKEAALRLFRLLNKSVVRIIEHHLERAREQIGNHSDALHHLKEGQGVYEAFEDVILVTDPDAGIRLGRNWLNLVGALGTPGLLGIGEIKAKPRVLASEANEVLEYLKTNYADGGEIPKGRKLAAWPVKSPTFDAEVRLPVQLPPGHNVNKQIPRPRQILNMAARGVDESETPLIALGDMVFDSAYIFGEPMRSLGLSCNTCHNKSITNPNFVIPGLSARPGGMDVSNGFFAPHANNGHFDPVDIPDLRGIRFTAPYGRNGRFASLREFTRNVIVNEFNGPEPDPMLLDGMIAYMNEFDFLPNPMLNKDGTLNRRASESARRGERIFNRPFSRMSGMSCATCHIPSAHFLDHRRHNIGSVSGVGVDSLDQAMDTPTLLSAKHTPPYFHDGSLPTLRAVNEWFNTRHKLGLSKPELDDLTAYVETVGDGVDAYEDSPLYLDAEMEEFSFFLSAFEFLDEKNKPELMNATFQTIALEIRNHKWELQDLSAMPVMDHLAELMEEAYAANQEGNQALVRTKVNEYREFYEANVAILK